MAEVKLCGVRTREALEAAIEARARWIGLVIFENSPRHVAIAQAAALRALARGRAQAVAVLVDPDDVLIKAIVETDAADILQLHGAETPARAAAIRALARRPVWKALGVSSPPDLEGLRPYEGIVDGFVFDAKPPKGASRPGGLGAAFDASILKGVQTKTPWLLSGGLTPDTLAAAIAASGARAVDVSSGVETAPGVKDRAKIAAFLEAARAAG